MHICVLFMYILLDYFEYMYMYCSTLYMQEGPAISTLWTPGSTVFRIDLACHTRLESTLVPVVSIVVNRYV